MRDCSESEVKEFLKKGNIAKGFNFDLPEFLEMEATMTSLHLKPAYEEGGPRGATKED